MNLGKSIFHGAKLSGVNLKGANLTNVDFSGADLSGANFGINDRRPDESSGDPFSVKATCMNLEAAGAIIDSFTKCAK